MSKIILPRIYKSEGGKFAHLDGLPKLSYSQITAWNEKKYQPDYIRQYFFGEKQDSGAYAAFGSACGESLEHRGQKLEYSNPLLSEKDIEILNSINLEEGAIYEREVTYEVKDTKGNVLFVLQGFIDKNTMTKKKTNILDYKTGNIGKKRDFYGGEEYNQTIFYMGALIEEGYEVGECGVEILDRKGNAFRGESLYLSGETEYIPTPFTKARFNSFIKDATKIAKEISEYYKVLLKVRGEL